MITSEKDQTNHVHSIVFEALKAQFDMTQRPLHPSAMLNGAQGGALEYMHYVTRETGYDWYPLVTAYLKEQGAVNESKNE